MKNENIKFKWVEIFYYIIGEFNLNKNYVLLNETINELFEGIPLQIAYSYISQFSI